MTHDMRGRPSCGLLIIVGGGSLTRTTTQLRVRVILAHIHQQFKVKDGLCPLMNF